MGCMIRGPKSWSRHWPAGLKSLQINNYKFFYSFFTMVRALLLYYLKAWKIYFVFCVSLLVMGLDYFWHMRKFNTKRLNEVTQDERDINGKVAIVTGSNAGIGYFTAKGLAKRGATVIMACRDLEKTKKSREKIVSEVPDAKLDIFQLDLANTKSIRQFCSDVKKQYVHIDILVNNGGVSVEELKKTEDDFEMNIGVNYLGHFLLTLLLLDRLIATENARIIGLTSTLLTVSHLHLDDLMLQSQIVPPFVPYANSKFAIAHFIKHLSSLLAGTSVKTYAVCTGVCDTQLSRSSLESWSRHAAMFTRYGFFTAEEGSQNVLYCALSQSLESESGRIYRFLSNWPYANWLLNDRFGSKLWEISEKLVGLAGFQYRIPLGLKD